MPQILQRVSDADVGTVFSIIGGCSTFINLESTHLHRPKNRAYPKYHSRHLSARSVLRAAGTRALIPCAAVRL